MSANFELAYAFTKKWEGGYVNDPDDPGGETKFGISKRAYPDEDIANLTEERAKEIYKRDYFDTLNLDRCNPALAVASFDTCVNCGLARTALWLEESRYVPDLLYYRKRHYETIAEKNPKLKKFLKGWMNRLHDLEKYISSLDETKVH